MRRFLPKNEQAPFHPEMEGRLHDSEYCSIMILKYCLDKLLNAG